MVRRLLYDPALRLAAVRAHLETLAGDELLLDLYRVVATAGTTGRHGLYLADEREWAMVRRLAREDKDVPRAAYHLIE